MLLVLLRSLTGRGRVHCVGVVTTLEPSEMRARLARGTLDELGLADVPVGAGSDGNARGDTKAMEGLDYMSQVGEKPKLCAGEEGMEVMLRALNDAREKSVSLFIVASLKDAERLLRGHEALFCAKIKEVVIQGGVQPLAAEDAAAGKFLQPDTSHNNEFDSQASAYVYERCQQLGVPLLVVSRFAAGACQIDRAIYDDMAATGSPIGQHLQRTQATSIERLWKQANAPVGSAVRGGLPARCDKAWFCKTFCGGQGEDRSGEAPIWDLIATFNMYDPLALLCALPSESHRFAFQPYVINSTTHRVVGLSKDATGIVGGAELSSYMRELFMEGIAAEMDRRKHLQTRLMRSKSAVDEEAIHHMRDQNEQLRREIATLKAATGKLPG